MAYETNTYYSRTILAILSFLIFVFIFRYSLYLVEMPVINTMFSMLRFVCWGLFILIYIARPKKPDRIGFWLLAYGIFVFAVSLLKNADSPFSVVSIGMDVIILWGIFNIYYDQFAERILRLILFAFCACIYTNAILLVLFPDGIWTNANNLNFFLLGGNYNQMGGVMLPALSIHAYYTTLYKKWHLNFWLLFIVSVCSILTVGSKTTTIGLFLFLAIYLIKSYRLRKWSLIILFSIYLTFQFMAVFLNKDFSSYPIITYFIEKVLGKDTTFTYRTDVWLQTFRFIYESPLYGYGYLSPDWYEEIFYVRSTHNWVLYILMCGGLIGLSLITGALLSVVRKYYQNGRTPSVQIVLGGLLVLFFMMIMEVYPFIFIILLMFVIYYHQDNRSTDVL